MANAVGIDEVGRGALAGPVVVGALSLGGIDPELLRAEILAATNLRRLGDSKKLSKEQRERVFEYLKDRLEWAVGLSEAEEIDRVGLAAALRLAAGRALDGISQISSVEADAGLFHPYEDKYPTRRTIKGDETILEIGLASIMAKVWRDRLMTDLALTYPGYGWEHNAGYGTKAHMVAIHIKMTPQHRRSFCK